MHINRVHTLGFTLAWGRPTKQGLDHRFMFLFSPKQWQWKRVSNRVGTAYAVGPFIIWWLV